MVEQMLGFDERNLRRLMGNLYKALILVTLGSLFAFAPLKGSHLMHARRTAATIVEVPETANSKVLWLDPTRVTRGQGDSFRLAYEE
jgi:hypothetical protein